LKWSSEASARCVVQSAYKGFKTPAVGIDAAVKILQDLGTSRWQLRIVFFTPWNQTPSATIEEVC
jgi:hypothetical protein